MPEAALFGTALKGYGFQPYRTDRKIDRGFSRWGNAYSALFFILILALISRPASAADLAILQNGFSIRHDHRQVIGATTRLFFSADDSSFTDVPTEEIASYEKDLSPPPTPATVTAVAQKPPSVPINEVVNTASATFHLDPDLVNSVIHAESGFNAHAVSPKGARGLMQLMPGTASQLGVNDAFDPEANVTGGSRYLRELLERYNFDLVKALAAYNAGPERVEQYQGVPPFRETRAYVARIVHEYNTKKIAQEKAEAKQKQLVARASTKAPSKSPAHAQHTAKPTVTAVAAQSQP
ncbi:MAG TPA: lytic transglycosylase domain-containing protein [Terriglobales bacterium]|nr:lytic transglycosylase domain-containing protein [Terriglobales bacterium]